jgi:hypothetical protein
MFVEKVIPKEPDIGFDGFGHLPRAAECQPLAFGVDKYQFQIVNEYRRKRRIHLLCEAVETSVFRKEIGIEAWRGVFIFLRPCTRKRRAVGSGLSVFTNPARRLVISAESFDLVIGILEILEKKISKNVSLSASAARAREERDSFNSLYSSLYILILLSLENSCVCRSFVD